MTLTQPAPKGGGTCQRRGENATPKAYGRCDSSHGGDDDADELKGADRIARQDCLHARDQPNRRGLDIHRLWIIGTHDGDAVDLAQKGTL